MGQRGALILVQGAPGNGAAGGRSARFGALDLLARLVGEVRRQAAHTVVVPVDTPIDETYREKYLREVTVGPPCPAASFPGGALAEAHRLLPADAGPIAVITADLPYLNAGYLGELFAALAPEADGICAAEGERRHPLLGVYRREVLERLNGGAGMDAPWEGLRMGTIPAEPVAGGGATIATRLESPEEYRRALTHLGFCDAAHPAITLELYGNLRIKTGCESLPMRGDRVETAFRVFRAVYPEAGRWLPETEALPEHFRFSINGSEVTTSLDHPLRENDQLILFSATVGG
jgi:molybdopterin-guanine dinucleotide biosynthesis protein A